MGLIKITIGLFLLGALNESAAQFSTSTIEQKFDAYQSVWLKTTPYLNFNQQKYYPGDTAFFKAYLLAENMVGVKGAQLLELNLIDSKGNVKANLLFSVNDGIGFNQLVIPDSLTAGFYVITAHSNWMKNFNPIPFFKNEIEIVRTNSLTVRDKSKIGVAVEGGHLVKDVSNKVTVQTYEKESLIKLVDKSGYELAQSITDNKGIGSIVFNPVMNGSYFVQVDNAQQIKLPPTEEDGCSILLTVSDLNSETIEMKVASPPDSHLRNQELLLIVNARGKIWHSANFRQDNKNFIEIQLPKNKLPEGVAHISILNPAGKLLASRDFYNHNKNQVQIKLNANKKYFHPREKVRLDISISDSNDLPQKGELSVTVTNEALFDNSKHNSFPDKLNIIRQSNEEFVIDKSDPQWMYGLDNWLILETVELPWKEILKENLPTPTYPSTSKIEITGNAYFASTHEPVPDNTQIMAYLQQSKARYQTLARNQGAVRLTLFDFFGQDEFFYVGYSKGREIPDLKIEWEATTIHLPKSHQAQEGKIKDKYASFSASSRIIDKSYRTLASNKTDASLSQSVNARSDFEDEIMGADIIVNIQDYLIFPNMEELIKEIIPSLYHRNRNNKEIVRVKYLEPNMATDDPIYVIDGIATRNTAFFLSLKPADLLTVKIVNDAHKLARFGLMGKNGIVMVQTKSGNVREPIDSSQLIQGLSKPISFVTKDYSTVQNLRQPGFRSTLYWNPIVKSDSNGKSFIEFYCSDDVGKLNIRIEGITANGEAFSTMQLIEILESPSKNQN